MDCTICCFSFNKKTRKPIDCPKCGEKTCVECIKKFLSSTLQDPHCMHCNHVWDLFFTNKILPRNYMSTDWRSSRAGLLLNREKSFFPETMPLVALEIEKENLNDELRRIEEQERALKARKITIYRRISVIEDPATSTLVPANKETLSFKIRQCPTPNCKGFLDTQNGSCIICNKSSCLQCNTNKLEGVEHECKQDDLDTWQHIQKSSKPCPNCATRIQRSMGCAQMWCPGCHVAFNWNTGQIEKGPIHNPHFYEWADRLGIQQPVAANRGNPCDANRVWYYYTYTTCTIPSEERKAFREIHQRLNHIINNEVVGLREKVQRNNTDLRIKFLRNQINEEHYKKVLIHREIQHQKDVRMLETLDTLNMVIVPLLQQFISNQVTYAVLINQIKNVEKFVNESITEINDCFKSKIGPLKIFGNAW